jgi:hypothetical protein
VLRILQHKPGSTYDDGDDARFNDFVHKVLARRACRGAGADIDRLDLYAWHWPGKSRADVWLRRAMRHTVGSLLFNVEGVSDWRPSRVELPTTTRVTKMWLELPTTTRVTKMWLELDGATLLLPPAVDFHKLTELTLGGIGFSDDDGPRLGHLLSSPSCCPTLRKLTLSGLSGLHHLRLHGGALETLDLSGLLNVRRLDVDAPRLALLHTDGFFMHYLHDDHTMPASPSGHPRWRDSKPPSRPAGSESNTTRSNCCTSAAPSMATRYAYLAPRYICLDHS